MKVILAQPRGFCAGVVRAIEIVERALQKYGPPVYVRHEIVHNKHVVESLKAKGAHFVEDLSEVPPNAVTIFSAHGVAKSVEEEAAARELPVLNATCPLVERTMADLITFRIRFTEDLECFILRCCCKCIVTCILQHLSCLDDAVDGIFDSLIIIAAIFGKCDIHLCRGPPALA